MFLNLKAEPTKVFRHLIHPTLRVFLNCRRHSPHFELLQKYRLWRVITWSTLTLNLNLKLQRLVVQQKSDGSRTRCGGGRVGPALGE